MTVLDVLRSVFPAPRRPLRGRDLRPIVPFLAIFGGGCLALELAGAVLFVRSEAFFLTIATVWLWWLFLAGATGLAPARATVGLWLRLMMAACFIGALAELRAVRTCVVL